MGLSFAEEVKGDFFKALTDSGVAPLLAKVNSLLSEQGIPGYVVGGFVRDLLLGRRTIDVDIAVAADGVEVARRVAGALNGKCVPLDEVNRVARVVQVGGGQFQGEARWQLDLSSFKGSIGQDLGRRDFTIDAMAVSLEQLAQGAGDVQLTDPYGGQEDLSRGMVRSVSETAFEADPARLLRAVRLAAELGFSIDEGTENQIRQHAHLIAKVAAERLREELLRLLAVSGSGGFLACLDELGLLTAIIPELAATKGVAQPKEHFWDVFDHSLMTVVATDFLLRQGAWEHADEDLRVTVPWSPELIRHFERQVSAGSTGASLLKLAALLHDIAKPQTRTIDGGRMRFLGHAQEGASMTVAILERLRFSTHEVRLVETMVRYHLRPGQMSQDGLPTRRAIYRYFRDAGDAAIGTLFLSLADHMASRGPNLDLAAWQEHTRVVDYVLTQHFEEERKPRPIKLVDGHDLINTLGISPGPRLGQLLEAVHEAHAAGELTTREEALDFVRGRLPTEGK